MNARVYVNGHDLGIYPYGYSSFCHDLTPYLQPGVNVLAVSGQLWPEELPLVYWFGHLS